MYTLTDDKKSRIFLACADNTYSEVGYMFELDKHLKTVNSLRDLVKRTYAAVKNDPEKYGVDLERANEVVRKVDERQRAGLVTKPEVTLRETNDIVKADDIKALTIGSRNKAMKIMHTKLGRIEKSNKAIDEMGLGELAKVAGILFDKGQIIQGQSTENISVLSKNIDANLNPEEALDMVLRMRETTMAGKGDEK